MSAAATATATPRRPANSGRPARPSVALLMGFEAFTLAVFATLHLSGALRIGSSASGRASYGAGVAEALICVALAGGAWALVHSPAPAAARAAARRRVARFALGFAITGFIVGLTFTVDSGDPIDLGYHLVMLPVLVATTVLLARRPAPQHM
ncbi:MAG: hypothetical protein JO130_10250 [Solirubrobacterales bacterium]|nr:hypothetical protein [Solirubrobacterales bacterium]